MHKNNIQISLFITDENGRDLSSQDESIVRESSSTIKIPILVMTLEKMRNRNDTLDNSLERKPHHSTQGSGIINWTNISRLSFRDLIYTTIVYSDCLATNILLDYIGGLPALNAWLAARNLSTRLCMPYLIFTGEEKILPKVGLTTAAEMAGLYYLFENSLASDAVKAVVDYSAARIYESWLEKSLPAPIGGLRHKTGSMINCGDDGETIYNATGSFTKNGSKRYFCLLSRGWLSGQETISPNNRLSLAAAAYFHSSTLKLV